MSTWTLASRSYLCTPAAAIFQNSLALFVMNASLSDVGLDALKILASPDDDAGAVEGGADDWSAPSRSHESAGSSVNANTSARDNGLMRELEGFMEVSSSCELPLPVPRERVGVR